MPEPKIPRFQPPDPEPKEEKTCYCQFCNEYFNEENMQDVDYEVCSECFDGVVSDARKFTPLIELLSKWTNEGLIFSDNPYIAKMKLQAIKTYLDGLK